MRRDLRSRLRPLSFTDILDETFELYKSNFVLLVGIAAVVYVAYFLIQSAITSPMGGATGTPQDIVRSVLVPILMLGVLMTLVQPVVTGALTYAISERYLARETSIKQCYRRIMAPRVLLPFLLVNLAAGAILGALYLVCVGLIVGAVFLMGTLGTGVGIGVGILLIFAAIAVGVFLVCVGLRFILIAPAYILEMNGWSKALTRSWDLMKGNVLKGLGLYLIVAVLVSVLTGMITGPTAVMVALKGSSGQQVPTALSIINMILGVLVSTVTVPLTSIVVILLYYDIRIRKEGFDLELLAREIDDRTREIAPGDITALPREQPVAEQPSAEPGIGDENS